MLALLTGLTACSEDEWKGVSRDIPFFHNTPLPHQTDSLRILAIGNSYTTDGTAYIGAMARSLGIDSTSYSLYTLTRGGASLKFWSGMLRDTTTFSLIKVAGTEGATGIKVTGTEGATGSKSIRKRGSLRELLAQHWDIVVLQQFSHEATDYQAYNPYLRLLIEAVRTEGRNPQVCLAWQLVHAYGNGYEGNNGLMGDQRWERIASATSLMSQREGIDVIIPTGTAIQIARHSPLQNAYDLTRDQVHLGYGVGRYIAAATWLQSLFGPIYGIDVTHCTATHRINAYERADTTAGFISASSVEVTEENRHTCLECAKEACLHPFSLRASLAYESAN